MYYLYPRLPLAAAEKLASERSIKSISELIILSSIKDESALFAPVGGNKADDNHLKKIQNQIRDCAKQFGYPDSIGDEPFRKFDIECSILLHKVLHVHPSEASHLEMWAFITCVLVPDIVRWRFPGEITAIERFIGSDRGLRRNTFGRLWWRAFLLEQPSSQDPYRLLRELVEDDLVQVTERNSIAASKVFLTTFCSTFLQAIQLHKIPRRLLMRESSKRVRRLLSLIAFDALEVSQVENLMNDVFVSTVGTLR